MTAEGVFMTANGVIIHCQNMRTAEHPYPPDAAVSSPPSPPAVCVSCCGSPPPPAAALIRLLQLAC